MNTLLKSSVAAALLAAAAVPAFSQTVITPPSSAAGITQTADATNGSGLIVEAFDAATGHSYTEWLGLSFAQFLPTASASAGSIDFGILGGSTAWTNFVTSEGGTANLQFVVEAGNNATANVAELETTINTSVVPKPTNTSVSTAVTKLAPVPGILTSNCTNANPCAALTSSDPGYTVNAMGPNAGGALGTSALASGALGTSLAFYEFVQNGSGLTGNNKQATQTLYAGTWSLGTNGDLTYTVAPVPLPAAAWLFGSGLLGLLGIGRRGRAVA